MGDEENFSTTCNELFFQTQVNCFCVQYLNNYKVIEQLKHVIKLIHK